MQDINLPPTPFTLQYQEMICNIIKMITDLYRDWWVEAIAVSLRVSLYSIIGRIIVLVTKILRVNYMT